MSRPIRVLIVEDCADDARLMLRELRRAGFEPISECVETEPEFVARLGPALDVILADYDQPEFDALRACAWSRSTLPTCRSSSSPAPWATRPSSNA